MPLVLRFAVLTALLLGLTLTALKWSNPEARLAARQKTLLSAVASRNWSKVEGLMSPDYQDTWHQNRSAAIETLAGIGSGFLTLDVTLLAQVVDMEAENGPTIRGRIEMAGAGGGFSSTIILEVNRLQEPFVFTWEKTGRLPWQWSLLSVQQPELARRARTGIPQF